MLIHLFCKQFCARKKKKINFIFNASIAVGALAKLNFDCETGTCVYFKLTHFINKMLADFKVI